jgi:hypothetical protein
MLSTINNLVLRQRNTKTLANYNHFDYELSLESAITNALVKDTLVFIGGDISTKDTEHMAVILANLIRDLSLGGCYTAISLMESKIPDSNNGFNLKRGKIKTFVLEMQDHGLLEFHIGSRDNEKERNLKTKIRATPKLIELIQSRSPVNIHLVRPANREPLKLRGKRIGGISKGDFIDYKNTEHTKRMRNRLLRYNQLLQDT